MSAQLAEELATCDKSYLATGYRLVPVRLFDDVLQALRAQGDCGCPPGKCWARRASDEDRCHQALSLPAPPTERA